MSTIIFFVGITLSLALSVLLLAALGSLGMQPGPVYYKLLGLILILAPFVSLLLKAHFRSSSYFDYLAGSVLIIVTVVYAVTMLLMNR